MTQLISFLVLCCLFQSALGVFLMWRTTTRSPKDDEPKRQLLKRDFVAPALKREPSVSFNTDRAYFDPAELVVGFGKRSAPFDPSDLGISFGKRSSETNPTYDMDLSDLGVAFGKRSADSKFDMDLSDLGVAFGKRSDKAFRWLRKQR
ncbi:hypothetical protein M3Y97_00183000 [Aphelenchoides bicaudatus]|nr:hypothetical protein M3Y97_00183000 [Aphelenchoides bicaudatus]